MPYELQVYELLKRIGSGYTARTLGEEDGRLVEGLLACMRAEVSVDGAR